MLRRFWIIFLGLQVSCSSNPYYDASKAHHTQSGFTNPGYDDSTIGALAFWKWKWSQLFLDRPEASDYQFPLATNDPEFLKNNRTQTTLTWIGHASFLLQHGGMNILTDPQFSERASPVSWAGPRRAVKPGLSIEDLPEIDAVVISHDHYDSLDQASIEHLAARQAPKPLRILAPLGHKSWFDDLKLNNLVVTELDWHQSQTISGMTFTATPVQHWGKRSLFDAYERLWAGWVIEASGRRIFFGGDTGYAPLFKDIGQRYGPFDLSLIPIGAYEPRWFMKGYHVNPEEAVKIHRDIGSSYSVAMHWGTFILTDERLDEPPLKLAQALEQQNLPSSVFEVYVHGETRVLDW